MSAMNEIATELELYWVQAKVGLYWERQLPFGQTAVISSGSAGYTLTVDREQVSVHETMLGALAAAGGIAVDQLGMLALTWTRS